MIPSPLLVVTDRHGSERSLTDTVRAVLDGGARWVWFRDRDLEPEARRDLAMELLALVREAGGWLMIGGDPALAAAIGADGAHLAGDVSSGLAPVVASEAKQSRAPPRSTTRSGLLRSARNDGLAIEVTGVVEAVASARRRLAPGARVGLSAHSLADVRAAAEAGADYVTLSPVFPSASKPGYGPALGPDALRAASAIGIPIIALGGIDLANARDCIEASASGIAVMGGLMRAADPCKQARRLLGALR